MPVQKLKNLSSIMETAIMLTYFLCDELALSLWRLIKPAQKGGHFTNLHLFRRLLSIKFLHSDKFFFNPQILLPGSNIWGDYVANKAMDWLSLLKAQPCIQSLKHCFCRSEVTVERVNARVDYIYG